jgi:exonuclease III
MMVDKEVLGNVFSFNTRGLASQKDKRMSVFTWLKKSHPGIIFLQETHSSLITQNDWRTEIGDQYMVYFGHGETNSRGVCTWIPKKLNKYIVDVFHDNTGRAVIILLDIDNTKYTLMNLYFPCQDKPADQLEFMHFMEECIETFNDTNIIIGGDINIVINPKLDKFKGEKDLPGAVAIELLNVLDRNNLLDVWRTLNPNLRRYTWRRREPLQQSRIDLWLISKTALYKVKECSIEIGLRSDHSGIHIKLSDGDSEKHGKSYWKFNNSLLEDKHYVEMINKLLSEDHPELDEIEDKRLSWEMLKMKIRQHTISYSINKSKEMRKEHEEIKSRLETLEAALAANNPPDTVKEEYEVVKAEWDRAETIKAMGSIARSRCKWVEEGEKPTKYFLNLEKHTQELKHIKVILDEDGNENSCPQEIMKNLRDFYKNLYRDKVGDINGLYNPFNVDVWKY